MMEKLRAAYQRMNQRERIMTLAIAAVGYGGMFAMFSEPILSSTVPFVFG